MELKGNLKINIDKTLVNNAVQRAVSKAYSSGDIESRLLSYGKQKIDNTIKKWISDGTLLKAIVKDAIKDIPKDQYLELIDKDQLQSGIVTELTDKIYKNLKL